MNVVTDVKRTWLNKQIDVSSYSERRTGFSQIRCLSDLPWEDRDSC